MGTWFARGKTSIVGRVIAGFFRETRGLAGAIVWVGLTIVLAIIMLSVLAPVLAPFDPSRKVANPETPPGGPFLMGTDRSGQDVFSRILWGGRVPLQVIVLSTLISLAVGVPLGLFSGFLGGRFDRVVVLVMDSVYAFPGLLLAIAIAAVIGRGILNISAAIAVVYIPTYFRVIRNHVSSVRSELYVDAAVALGIPKWRVIGKYVLPNVAQNIPVIFSTGMGTEFPSPWARGGGGGSRLTPEQQAISNKIVDEIAPIAGEVVIKKASASALVNRWWSRTSRAPVR